MYGIIEILGKTDLQGRIVDGLSRLEYRGYDSAGVAIMSDAKAPVSKAAEVTARGARLIEVGCAVSADKLKLPMAPNLLEPCFQALAVQMIAYFTALDKGTNLDQPKNLAKIGDGRVK